MIETTTFLELLRQGGVLIPHIQRDYAQGRPQKSAQELRERFLEALHHALTSEEGLHLDFVCGLRSAGGFIPLDGQQRLTTLFLLHWYTLEEAAEPAASEGFKPALFKHFRYETRSTTSDFLREMIEHRALLLDRSKALGGLRAAVEDQCWYQASWSDDPSVVGMLVMLDAIEERFGAQCRKLTPEELRRITFHLVTLNEQTEPDLLYRKINSRGRKLSAYENFKAELLQALRADAAESGKDPAAYADFEQSLDGAWSDAVFRLLQAGGAGGFPGAVGAAEGGAVSEEMGGNGVGFNGFEDDATVGEEAGDEGVEDKAAAVDRALLNLFCGYARLFFPHRGRGPLADNLSTAPGAGDDARLRAGAYLEALRGEKGALSVFVGFFRSGMEWWLTPLPHRICEEHLAARQQGARMALPDAPPNVVTNFEGREANPFLRLCREGDELTQAARRETLCYLYAVYGLRKHYRSLTPDAIRERLMLLRNLLNNGTFDAKSLERLIPWSRKLMREGAEAVAEPSPPEGSGFWPRQWEQEKIKLAWRKQSKVSDLRVLDCLENHDLLRGDASLAIKDGAYRPDLAAALLRVLPQEGAQKLRQCALLSMACALTSPLMIKGSPPKYLLYQTSATHLSSSLRAASGNKGLKKSLRELLDALGDRDLGAYLDSFVDEKAGLDSRSYLIRYRAAVFRLILPRAAGSAAPLREAWPECFYDFGKDKSAPSFASLRLRKQQVQQVAGSSWFRLLPELIRCLCAEEQEDRVRVDETSAEGDTLLIAPTAAGEGEGCGVSLRCRRDAFVIEKPGKPPVAIPIRRSVSEGESRDVVDRVLLGCAVVRAILRPCEAGKCQLSGKPGESCSLKLPTYDAASGRLGAGSGPELALKLTAAKVSKKA